MSADGLTPRRLRVFLCHSTADKAAVRDLCNRLRQDGFDPWLDERALLSGQAWQDEIQKAIRTCDAVVDSSYDKQGGNLRATLVVVRPNFFWPKRVSGLL